MFRQTQQAQPVRAGSTVLLYMGELANQEHVYWRVRVSTIIHGQVLDGRRVLANGDLETVVKNVPLQLVEYVYPS